MSDANVDLRQAVTDQDLYTIQCFVVDQQNLLLKSWRNKSHQSFRSPLQRSLQQSSWAKRQLIASEDEIPYQMGVWEGWIQAFRTLYEEESKENDILELAVAHSSKTAEIIRFLYQYDRPICHGEWADALEMNYSALTNAMKRAIGCGAVSASRTGRNTRYTLTTAGRQYCQEEAKWENVLSKKQEYLLVEKVEKSLGELKELLKGRRQPGAVVPSDKVRLYQKQTGELSDPMQLKAVYDIGGLEKILELDNTSDTIGDTQKYKEEDIFSNCNPLSHMVSST